MGKNPEGLILYWEDLEYLKEILGPTTVLEVSNVPYKEFKEFEKKYYNKKIDNVLLKNKDGDLVELSPSGWTYVQINDREIALKVKNFLFSKQPKVEDHIKKCVSFFSKVWATFVILIFLYIVLVVKDKEFNSKLFDSSFGVIGLIFLPDLLFIVIPSKYKRHNIICRTSDDKQKFFQNPTFQTWVIPILTGAIGSLLAAIIFSLLID